MGLVPVALRGVGGADVVVGGLDGRLALKVGVGLVDGLGLALKVGGGGRRVGEICGDS